MKNGYLSYKVKLIKGNHGEGAAILPIIKRNFGYHKYSDSIKTIINNRNYIDYFKYELFPTKVDDIVTHDYIPLSFDFKHFTENNIVNEILCFISFLTHFEEKIRTFSKHRLNFECALLTDKRQTAIHELNNIQAEFGTSFWLLESQLLYCSIFRKVVDSEKKYQEIKEQAHDYYIKHFIRALRRKTKIQENLKDSLAFLNKKEKDFSENSVEIWKQIYYNYSYEQPNKISNETVYNLIIMASQLNLVDMFLLLDKVIINILCDTNYSLQSKREIFNIISNNNLPFSCKCTIDLLSNKADWSDEITQSIYKIKSEIYNTDSKSKHSLIALEKFPNIFEIVVNYSKIDIIHPQNKTINGLLDALVSVIKNSFLKRGNYDRFIKVTNDAARLLLLLSSTTMYYSYYNFYQDIFYADSSQDLRDVLSSAYYNRNVFNYYKNSVIEEYFNGKFGSYESNWYHNWEVKKGLDYDIISIKLNEIEHTKDSLPQIHEALQKENSIIHEIIDNRGVEQLFLYYINTNNILAAIKLYVELQFQSKLKVHSFNNDLLSKKCNALILRDLYPSIDFCIYAHLTDFRGASGLRFNIQSANSFLEILKSNKVMFPSELKITDLTLTQKQKYAYFFRHICEEELLKSKLLGYSINEENDNERISKIFKEREKLLCKAIDLDDPMERNQIEAQLEQIRKKMKTLDNLDLEETLLTNAKILKESILVSDTDIIYPFKNNCDNIRIHTLDNFCNYTSGEFLLFKDSFIKYKKAYIQSLDKQIGINIRHGFLKNEIINFFSKHDLIVEDNLSIGTENNKYILSSLKKSKEKEYLIPYIDKIVNFSKEIYDFIDITLKKLVILPSSTDNDDIYKIYISNEEISRIATHIIGITDPYNFKEELQLQMTSIMDSRLSKIGISLENRLSENCVKIINNNFCNIPLEDITMQKKITLVKEEIPKLCSKIREWFRYVNEGEELCSLSKYAQVIDKRRWNITLNISSSLPDVIRFKQLHCIDLIFCNLIMNAEEHSGLSKSELQISTSLNKNKNKMIIDFKNNLSPKKKKETILNKMDELEKNIKTIPTGEYNGKGNGFYYIAATLNSLVGEKWSLSFCKSVLPNYFALSFEIDWGFDFD